MPTFQEAVTKEHIVLAGKYHYFVFESKDSLLFKPGQYISIKVAPVRINCYSIACSLSDNLFGLLIDISPGGPGSKFFENLQAGDPITYLGPFGVFTYKETDGAENILFLATGSGVAPIRDLIDFLLKNRKIQTPITLYFGLRFEEDIFWKEYFEQLAREYLNFHFILSLSKPTDKWAGKSGHITTIIQKELTNASAYAAYLCGGKAMVDEGAVILQNLGCPKERIYLERF